MKTNNTLNYTMVMMLLSLISCADMVEPDRPTNQISSIEVYNNTGMADAVLNNLYVELQYNSVISGGAKGLGSLMGSYSDDLDNYMSASQTAYLDIYNTQVLPTNTVVKTLWGNAYKEIYICNALLEGISQSASIAADDKNRLTGEALLVRSLIHLRLMQIFGDIPYISTTDFKVNQIIQKTNAENILVKVIADLQSAKGLLKTDYRSSERTYPNRYAAVFLLLQAYMLQEDWQKAQACATEMLSSSLYSINTDLNLTFKKDGKNIIWQLKPLQTGEATAEAQLYSFSGVPQNYTLSADLVNSFGPTDLRKTVWIKKTVSGSNIYYGNAKYKNTTSNTDEYSVIFRIEEVYCMLSEILARQNRINESLIYLNAVRSRAGLSNIPNTLLKEELLTEILLEKRREFFSESGLRFFDLKRFGKLGELQAKKINWKDFRSLWPIPQSEIMLNSNLNPQNPGY